MRAPGRMRRRAAIALALGSLLAAPPLVRTAGAASLVDVGTHPVPPPTTNAATWTMASACYDINEAGEAACLSTATGPSYCCGFRCVKRCSAKDSVVAKWSGDALVRMTPGTTATGEYRHNNATERPT